MSLNFVARLLLTDANLLCRGFVRLPSPRFPVSLPAVRHLQPQRQGK